MGSVVMKPNLTGTVCTVQNATKCSILHTTHTENERTIFVIENVANKNENKNQTKNRKNVIKIYCMWAIYQNIVYEQSITKQKRRKPTKM